MLCASPPPKLRQLLLPLVICAIGAAFRFYNLGLVRLTYDDSYPMYDALRMLDEHTPLLVGQPSSVFLDNPPLMSYLQALPLLVRRSPWAAYLFIVALNTVAIWLVFRVAQKMLGDRAGYLSAFLFAVNPWMATFSRTAWVQALLPFFSALVAWALWPILATARREPRRMLIAGVAVTAMTQTYIQAWGVLAQVGLLMVLFFWKIPRRSLCAGVLIFLAATALYGIGLAQRWETNRPKLETLFSGGFQFNPEALEHAVRLVTGFEFDAQSQAEPGQDELRSTLSQAAHTLLGAALAAGMARAALELLRRRGDHPAATILLLWWNVPIVLAGVSGQLVHPHYLLLTSPAGYVLAAWGLSLIPRFDIARWVAIPLLACIAVIFWIDLDRVNQDVAQAPTAPNFDGWSLEAAAEVGSAVRELTTANVLPRRVVADGHAALLSSMSGVSIRSLHGLDFPDYVVLPGSEPLLYILVNTPAPVTAVDPHQQPFPERSLVVSDGTRVTFRLTLPYARHEAAALPAVKIDWPSESGLSLLGYDLPGEIQPGAVIECTTYWRVDEWRPGYEEWHIAAFYQILNPVGQKVVEASRHGQWSRRWQLGDVYIERVEIALPEDLAVGDYSLEIGLFDSVHLQHFSLVSPAGPIYSLGIPIQISDKASHRRVRPMPVQVVSDS